MCTRLSVRSVHARVPKIQVHRTEHLEMPKIRSENVEFHVQMGRPVRTNDCFSRIVAMNLYNN